MKIIKRIRNYFFYCGIEKDEFNSLKKDAYISNFEVWKILHILMAAVFSFLFINSLFSEMLRTNLLFYLIAMVYSIIAAILFFVMKKTSIIGQLFIYLSISLLFLFGCFITKNNPENPATTFIVLLIITPMFMIDKPYFMSLELCVASTVYLIWMYYVKPYDIWKMDLINILIYTVLGIFIHIIANSIRIKEFVLTRKINIQKDTDELTGLKNKGALTREINEYIGNSANNKGIMLLLDIDRFKSINDTYGHDVGDVVINSLGSYLAKTFTNGEIVGRFGGDEFLIFIKGNDSIDYASSIASIIVADTASKITIPNKEQKISVSIGLAIYHGVEKNYSELFKKADIALYKTKGDATKRFCIYNKEEN